MGGRGTAQLAPGDLVVGRHRLLREVARGPGTSLWQAEDEVLARSVAVRVLTDPAPDGLDPDTVPLDGPFLAAALRAGRVSDPRVARVYDAADSDGVPVVVREWVEGEPLSEVLRRGPLSVPTVARVGVEIAAALTAAHARDVWHGALHPGDVVLTPGGVKLTDLEVAAALEGRPVPADPAERGARDARCLGAVLYAASTGCWPHSTAHGLPRAPENEGRVCTPHQVRAAVPRSLDAVITGAMRGAYPTPGAVAVALAPLAAAGSAVDPAAPTARTGDDTALVDPDAVALGPVVEEPVGSWRHVLVVLLVLAIVAVGGWTMGLATGQLGAPRQGPQRMPSPAAPADTAVLRPVSVQDFDPPPGDGAEHPAEARLATDNDPATGWTTDTYRNRPDLGGLKPGVGILLDLGEPEQLSRIQLELGTAGGTIELRAGTSQPSTGGDLPVIATLVDPAAQVDVPVDAGGPVRYVLVWLTSLPPRGSGFGAEVREVVLHGRR